MLRYTVCYSKTKYNETSPRKTSRYYTNTSFRLWNQHFSEILAFTTHCTRGKVGLVADGLSRVPATSARGLAFEINVPPILVFFAGVMRHPIESGRLETT